MLDLSEHRDRLADAWEATEQQTRLPAHWADYLEHLGMTPDRRNSRRAYPRFYIRGKAILCWQGVKLGVYTGDASRSGVGFFSPIELESGERVSIRLPNTKEFRLEVVRCRRIQEDCYECGAVFVLGAR